MSKLIKLISIVLFSVVFTVIEAKAATITVGTFEDEDFGDGGNCSLRAAVISANQDAAVGGCTAGSGEDTIVLQAGTYTLTKSCEVFNCSLASAESGAASGATCSAQATEESVSANSDSNTYCDDLDVYENLTVTGVGKGLTIITVNSDALNAGGNNIDYSFRAFDVHTENLQPTTVESSEFSGCEDTCQLGTSLLLKDMSIQGAEDTNGGAVRVKSDSSCTYGKLETQSVAFNENYADRNGGAVYVRGQYVGSATDYTSNAADNLGGGLYLDGNTLCPVTNSILNSTFDSNNSYDEQGGALYADTDTTVEIAGSTFENNHAYEAGGAIAAITGSLSITNTTITNNGLDIGEKGSYIPAFGGGIFVGDLSDFRSPVPASASGIKSSGSEYGGQNGEITLLVQNSTISNNQALFGGGGIASIDNFFEINFIDNVAKFGKECDDGVIIVTANVRDSIVKDNIVAFYDEEIFEDYARSAAVATYPLILPVQIGGGIAHTAFGKFAVENSTVDGNKATLGGGIANFYELSVAKSTVSNNQAVIGDLFIGGFGGQDQEPVQSLYTFNLTGAGGVFNSGSADIVNSTISGNKTDGAGAGLLNYTDFSYAALYEYLLDINNPETMGEQQEFELPQVAAPGSRLNNDTIANNEIVEFLIPEFESTGSQTSNSLTYLNNGGGIAAVLGKITLSNTIVATNKDDFALVNLGDIFIPIPVLNTDNTSGTIEVAPTPQASPTAEPADPVEVFGDFAPDCYVFPVSDIQECQVGDVICAHYVPQIISEQHNLIGNNLGCTAFQPAENANFDIVGTPDAVVNPLISALANNGGTTLTHFLNKGSPAIDNGSGAIISAVAVAGKGCQPDDQRSVARPVDGNNDSIAVCDIGSVEVAVDCDGVPGGNKVKDACGVCGGNGTSCIPTPTPVPDAPLSCTQTDVTSTLIVLDGSAHNLNNLTNSLLRTISNKGGKTQKANKKFQTQSNELFNKAWGTTWVIPAKIQSDCTGGANLTCTTVSNEGLKSDYSASVNQLYQLNQELLKQLNKLKKANKKLKAKLQSQNDKYLATALTTLNTVPGSTINCN